MIITDKTSNAHHTLSLLLYHIYLCKTLSCLPSLPTSPVTSAPSPPSPHHTAFTKSCQFQYHYLLSQCDLPPQSHPTPIPHAAYVLSSIWQTSVCSMPLSCSAGSGSESRIRSCYCCCWNRSCWWMRRDGGA